TATRVAFMPMLRIGDTGGGTTVDEANALKSLAIFRARLDHLEKDRRRGTIYPRTSTFRTVVAYHLPPRAVCIPPAFSACAISRSVRARISDGAASKGEPTDRASLRHQAPQKC